MSRVATRDFVVTTARAVRWAVPLAAYGLVMVLLLWRRDDLSGPASALGVVRVVGVLLVVGALPLLDDASARQVAAAPTPLRVRVAPRLLAMTVLVLLPVGVLAAATGPDTAAIVLEVSAILAVASAAALLMARFTDQLEPSTVVSVGVLVLPLAMFLLPTRFAFYVSPGPNWSDAHVRWAVLLGVGLLALAYALRDPAGRPLRRLWRAPHNSPQTRSSETSDAPVISS